MDSSVVKKRKLIKEWRKWEELDVNILRKIVLCVHVYDTITKVSLVCRSWKLACWDALFWGQTNLDLSPLIAVRDGIEFPPWVKACKSFDAEQKYYESVSMILMKFLKRILIDGQDALGFSLDHWRLSIKTLFIPKDLKLSHQHLCYLAERIPNLESLVLAIIGSSMIRRGGFAKAIANWKKIQHLRVEFERDREVFGGKEEEEYFLEILQEICKNCSQLVSLHVTSRLLFLRADDITQSLVTNLQQLKTLKFEGAKLFKSGMDMLLNNSLNNLEAIYFCNCNFMQYDGGYALIFDPSVSFSIRFSQTKQKWSFDAVACSESALQNKFQLWMQGRLPSMHWDWDWDWDLNDQIEDDNILLFYFGA